MPAPDPGTTDVDAPMRVAVPGFPTVIASGAEDRRGQEVRLALRVLLALAARPAAAGVVVVAPLSATQEGLAARLSVTQGAVSKVLRQLRAADVIRRDQGHVDGFSRRVRFYSLTPRGLGLVQAYRRRFGDRDPPPGAGGDPH